MFVTYFLFVSKRARPIHKLCEFEGNIPENHEPDCYKDVDESDYACKEKYRIFVSMFTKLLLLQNQKNTSKEYQNN